MADNVANTMYNENSSKQMNINTFLAFLFDLPHLEKPSIISHITFKQLSNDSYSMVYTKPNQILMNRLAMAAKINPVARHYLNLDATMTAPQLIDLIATDAGNEENQTYYQHMMAFYEIFGNLEHKKFHYDTQYLPDSPYRVYQFRAEVELLYPESVNQQNTLTYCTAVVAKNIAAALDIFQDYSPDILGLKNMVSGMLSKRILEVKKNG